MPNGLTGNLVDLAKVAVLPQKGWYSGEYWADAANWLAKLFGDEDENAPPPPDFSAFLDENGRLQRYPVPGDTPQATDILENGIYFRRIGDQDDPDSPMIPVGLHPDFVVEDPMPLEREALPGLVLFDDGFYYLESDTSRRASGAEVAAARELKQEQQEEDLTGASRMQILHEPSTGYAFYMDPNGNPQYYRNPDGSRDSRLDKDMTPDTVSPDTAAIIEGQNTRSKDQITFYEKELAETTADRIDGTAEWMAKHTADMAAVNASLANKAAELNWLKDKFAVETALGRDKLALQTEVSMESALAEQRALTFQYGQLQQDARQFNATTEIAVNMENARRKELQQARRAQLASEIGQLAQDAGSRGELASMLLANPDLGLLSESLAGGQDFFTEESLAPLSDLLRQREDASRDPNLATFDPIQVMDAPDIPDPQFTMPPGQYNLPRTTSTGPTMTREESDAFRANIKAQQDAAAAAPAGLVQPG
jgi:hypothetical protein